MWWLEHGNSQINHGRVPSKRERERDRERNSREGERESVEKKEKAKGGEWRREEASWTRPPEFSLVLMENYIERENVGEEGEEED